MPSTRPDLTRGPRCLVALVAAALLLSGCSTPADQERQPAVAGAISDVLERRADAVLRGRPRDFLATVDPSRPWLRRRQQRWYDNLRQLPVGHLSFDVRPGTVTERAGRQVAVVRSRLQLRGFDAWPVVSLDRVTFRRTGQGRLVVSRVVPLHVPGSDPRGPWDRRRLDVVRRGRVLGVFDRGSRGHAAEVLSAVQRALPQVEATVPGRLRRGVVVHALSDTLALSQVPRLPGGDPDRLDAVTVGVGQRADGYAAMRVVLHPRLLEAAPARRDRLIRHELTHVVLAGRADGVPTWLSEGIAELVSVRPLPRAERPIAVAAVRAARAAPAELPGKDDFAGPGSGAAYGLAWWACEVVAGRYGERALWRLLSRADPETGTDRLLRDVLGIGEQELARAAARRIVATYAG